MNWKEYRSKSYIKTLKKKLSFEFETLKKPKRYILGWAHLGFTWSWIIEVD